MATVQTSQAFSAERQFDFRDNDFSRVRRMIYERAGISLGEHKREMVYSRLARRLRALGRGDFAGYLDHLEHDPAEPEWENFVNALTTNLTAFFREAHHFPVLADFVRTRNMPVSVWCCAASTGEEPYSIAITLAETLGSRASSCQVVATDIDTQCLTKARAGVYPFERVSKMDEARLKRFFLRGKGSNSGHVKVRPEIQEMVRFETLNLLAADWPLSERFDAIFCRNVMIYFDKPTQARVLKRLCERLKRGGYLFIGHSETVTGFDLPIRQVANTVFKRI